MKGTQLPSCGAADFSRIKTLISNDFLGLPGIGSWNLAHKKHTSGIVIETWCVSVPADDPGAAIRVTF